MKHNAERILVVAAACITALVTTVSPLVAQEVIALPAEDRILSADFEELYRVGSLLGHEWAGPAGRVRGEGRPGRFLRGSEASAGSDAMIRYMSPPGAVPVPLRSFSTLSWVRTAVRSVR